MSKTTLSPIDLTADPVPLAAAAVHSLIQPLPSGTAFCIGIVLIVMMTGRLVQTKGSLARAVLPFVVHLRWGWHRVERAMERGTFSLDAMFDQAADWCPAPALARAAKRRWRVSSRICLPPRANGCW